MADRRIGGRWSPWRIGAVAALLIGAALLPSVHPTLALGVAAVVLIASGVADRVTREPQTDAGHR